MSVSYYQYTADDTTVYQVQLPDDFAVALGFTLATGAEPYLPVEISPRYGNYFSPVAKLSRQAVFKTRAQGAAPPSPLTVSGNVYDILSVRGEAIPPVLTNISALVSMLQGPPGAQGPRGFAWLQRYMLSADVVLADGASATLWTVPVVAGEKYFFQGQVQLSNASTTTPTRIEIGLSDSAGVLWQQNQWILRERVPIGFTADAAAETIAFAYEMNPVTNGAVNVNILTQGAGVTLYQNEYGAGYEPSTTCMNVFNC